MCKYQGISLELERFLCLRSKPLAVKMLRIGEEAPKCAVRPLQDTGHHLSLCQAFSMSRRQGKTIAMFPEDNWCCEPVIGFGLKEPPEYFLQGYNRYPNSVSTLEAGSRWAHQLPRWETGRFAGILLLPLEKAEFEPDVVIMYCDPAQLTYLLIAVNWIDGNDVTCTLGGHAACVYSVIPSMKNNQFYVTIPCSGDRVRAVAQDNELIFSFPIGKAEGLLRGLHATNQSQSIFPIEYGFQPEYKLSESYQKISQLMGVL